MRTKASVEVLGVYTYVPDRGTINRYAQVLADVQGAEARREAAAFLRRAVLIEALVHHPTKAFNFRFGQDSKGMNEFAWSPRALTLDGSRQLSPAEDASDYVGRAIVRCAFFIHDFDKRKPLKTQYGVVKLAPAQPMPLRLQRAMPYEVVD